MIPKEMMKKKNADYASAIRGMEDLIKWLESL